MDLRQMRYFVTVAEEGHFGRAAQRISISQPPLSLAIRQLEQELGAKLFERTSRKVNLTRAGSMLFRQAQSLLRRVEDTKKMIKTVADGHCGQVKVGFAGSMLYRGLPEMMACFGKEAPDIEVILYEMNSLEQIDALRHEEIDVAFVLGRGVPNGLEGFCYHTEPFVACLPACHPSAHQKFVPLAKLKEDPFVLFSRRVSPDYHESIIASCRAAGFLPQVRHEVRYWLSVVSLVAHGMGVALVPRTLRKSEIAGVSFRPIKPNAIRSETWCVWQAKPEDPPLERLLRLIERHSSGLGKG